MVKEWLKKMGIPVAIQLTFACPNIGENFRELVSTEEKIEVFKIFSELDIHVGVKINVFQSILEILEIVKKVQCSWVEIPNTYPIEKANKKFLFRYAGGGTSSRKNFEAALDWQSSSAKAKKPNTNYLWWSFLQKRCPFGQRSWL